MHHAPRAALVAVLLLACASTPALAQRLSIRTFSAADGLGSSFVSDIMQDAAGYLWFATRDGLNRWNGYEFVTLGAAGGFTSPAVDRIRQTRSGEYFVICNDGSLYSYRPSPSGPSRSTPRRLEDGRESDQGKVLFRRRRLQFEDREVRFTRLYEDRQGILWAGGQGVLVKGLGTTNTVISLGRHRTPSGGLVIVHALLEDRSGSMWIGTTIGLLRVLPDGSIAHYSISPGTAGDGVNALALDGAGRIWIGHSWHGVVVMSARPPAGGGASHPLSARRVNGDRIELPSRDSDAIVLTTANGLPDDKVVALLATSDGHVWVGTGNGIGRFDGTTFTRYTRENGLCDNLVHALREDGDHHVWVATPTGAMRLVLEGFAGYTAGEGLSANRVASLVEGPAGTVCAIDIDWSVNWFDGRRFRTARLPLPPGTSLMWASQAGHRDSKGRWWALTNQGLFRFDRAREGDALAFPAATRVYGKSDGLPSAHVFRLYEDRPGTIWVGTRSGDPLDNGLARFDAALARATPFGPAEGLPLHAAPSAFAEDRRGNLWIGFYDGGLARYSNGRFRFYREQDGIPPGMVTSLLVDGSGRLWIATNAGGIGRADDPAVDPLHVKTYSTRDGLSSNNVRVLVEDRLGHIFAGSVRGVDRVDPATGRVRQYGPEDGLLKDFVTSALRDSHGDLWFGTYGGVYRLRPGREREEEPPPIAITGIRVAGDAYQVQELGETSIDGMVLAPDQRDVAIEFVSVSRHRAQGISYQYSIDGANTEWSTPTTSRSVNFARLAPGAYRFAVRAVTPGGTVSRTPAVVTFTIRPPLWQRWWVISLAVVGAGAILLALYRYRVRRLLEIQRLRMAIASDLHDEVATNLSSIAMFSTLVRGEAREPSPFLDRITVLATESVEALREIIWSIDPKPETISGLLQRLRDAMVTTCRAQGIQLTVAVAPDGLDQNLTPEQRKNIWLMLKEAVTNAVKHSGGTEVSVMAAPAGPHVRIVVRDNGKGASLDAASSGLGLATMRARAEALGGTATLTVGPDEGTSVEFVVKLAG